jgi:Holliday junction resolvase RusA-like endonuclease
MATTIFLLLMALLVIVIVKREIESKANKKLPRYYKSKFSTDFTLKLSKENDQLKEQIKQLETEVKRLDEKRIELAKEFYHYRNLANKLDDENKRIWDKYIKENMENSALKRKNADLELANDQLMDKIINHLKAKDIISDKKSTVTKIATPTPKIKANEIIKPAINDTRNWLKIDAHGFSVNKMYTATSNGLVKSFEYNSWIDKTLRTMKNSGMKSLRSMCVNPNKPMKLEVEFKLVRGSDTDNPLKSFIDLLVRYYGLTDDNNFVDIHVTRNPIWANSYSDGKIKFKITNI